MNIKENVNNFLTNLFSSIGIDPLLGVTILFLFMILLGIKKLKMWDVLPDYKKHFLISGWIVLLLAIITLIIGLFQD